jgi:photosystem II stability/assembly factor-like uncharacterized protein
MVLSVSLVFSTAPGSAQASYLNGPPYPQLVVRGGTSAAIYVLWSDTCKGRICFRLMRSLDGGQTFTPVTAPPIATGSPYDGSSTGSLDQLVFANAEDGYATEDFWSKQSTLYATFNGGDSWHREQIKGASNIQSLTSSPTSFYAITERCDATHAHCTDWHLSTTRVATSSWTSTPVPNDFLRHVDPSFGIQLAAYGDSTWILAQTKGGAQQVLASSTNGGRSFSVETVRDLGGAATCSLVSMSTSALWATCAQGMQLSELLYSSDGGGHWGYRPEQYPDAPAFGYFDPISSDVAYAANGYDTNNARTIFQVLANSGRLDAVGHLPTNDNTFYFLAFVNSQQGVAYAFYGQGATQPIWSTDDGGRTWRQVTTP